MTSKLHIGLSSVHHIVVDLERTIAFMGERVRVYATPRLIGDIEHTCRDLIAAHVPSGEDSLGIEVAVRHLAPTLAGSRVEIAVHVSQIEDRRITLSVSARDELETICTGTHTRFVVNVARTEARLRARAERLRALHG